MPNPTPKQTKQFLEQQDRMRKGEIQKLPRGKGDKIQTNFRIRKDNHEWIKQWAKERNLLKGDALDLILQKAMESENQ